MIVSSTAKCHSFCVPSGYGKVYTVKYINQEGDNMKEELPERCI
jgi:hypothetical protein